MDKKALILLVAFLAGAPISCSKKDKEAPPSRSEFIKVYETSEDKAVDNIQVPFEGVKDGKIHILSNVPLQWKYMIDQSEPDQEWLKIKSVQETDPGHFVVSYDAASLLPLNSLERRGGRLSFSCPEQYLGKFIPIRQGYSQQFIEDFSNHTDGFLTLTGKQTFTTREYPELNKDYFDYISFNAWAETDNEFRSKNITLDVSVSGGQFYDTRLTTYRVNIPIGTGADQSNLKFFLLMGNGERMSAKTHFTFSVANDDRVFVHVDNFAAYVVTEAEMISLFEDEELLDDEVEWE